MCFGRLHENSDQPQVPLTSPLKLQSAFLRGHIHVSHSTGTTVTDCYSLLKMQST